MFKNGRPAMFRVLWAMKEVAQVKFSRLSQVTGKLIKNIDYLVILLTFSWDDMRYN